jgi:hypothetical protein
MRWEGWMSRRTFHTIFIVVMGLAFLPTIFPVFTVANRVEPLVFGFPFSFFWVVAWILVVFSLLVVMYLMDPDR